MDWLIDTNIAIHLRDGNQVIVDRIDTLPSGVFLSIVSQIELENGVYASAQYVDQRRNALDALLKAMLILPFEHAAMQGYHQIVATCGYSRRRVMDRMIAATAIAHSLTLITLNPADFRDIPGLELEAW